jgi:uncharacterized membrane protein (DUF485 family)
MVYIRLLMILRRIYQEEDEKNIQSLPLISLLFITIYICLRELFAIIPWFFGILIIKNVIHGGYIINLLQNIPYYYNKL